MDAASTPPGCHPDSTPPPSLAIIGAAQLFARARQNGVTTGVDHRHWRRSVGGYPWLLIGCHMGRGCEQRAVTAFLHPPPMRLALLSLWIFAEWGASAPRKPWASRQLQSARYMYGGTTEDCHAHLSPRPPAAPPRLPHPSITPSPHHPHHPMLCPARESLGGRFARPHTPMQAPGMARCPPIVQTSPSHHPPFLSKPAPLHAGLIFWPAGSRILLPIFSISLLPLLPQHLPEWRDRRQGRR